MPRQRTVFVSQLPCLTSAGRVHQQGWPSHSWLLVQLVTSVSWQQFDGTSSGDASTKALERSGNYHSIRQHVRDTTQCENLQWQLNPVPSMATTVGVSLRGFEAQLPVGKRDEGRAAGNMQGMKAFNHALGR